tara:strand:+ start:60 stop:215 length:156 start_codon:yes stop_codon:yes gene_type:complete
MIDPTLPPQRKYVVVDKNNIVQLITSNREIANWYQFLFQTDRVSEIPIAKK